MAVEDDVDALYAADPDGFVAGRQALVKRLKAEGDKAGAAEVAGLRRPTAAAWAVNQLARRHGDEVAALVALGDDLRRTHERLLTGGRDDDTAASGRRRREAIADLVERAAGILTESGRAADAHRDAISATLDAASLDPDVAAEVVAGRLSKELDPPSGFGEFDWSAPARPGAAPRSTPKAKEKAAAPAADDEANRGGRTAGPAARRGPAAGGIGPHRRHPGPGPGRAGPGGSRAGRGGAGTAGGRGDPGPQDGRRLPSHRPRAPGRRPRGRTPGDRPRRVRRRPLAPSGRSAARRCHPTDRAKAHASP